MSPDSDIATRTGAAHWARPPAPSDAQLDVLIPTVGRGAALAVTLSGLASQEFPRFNVIISDQSDDGVEHDPVVLAMVRVLEAQGRRVRILRHLPRRGLAEQRQFLLDHASAPTVLYLDDDVWLEPDGISHLHAALAELRCGFVGYASQGLSFLNDRRPEETDHLEIWGREGVLRERVRRDTREFERWPLHNAANLTHLAAELELDEDDRVAYAVAWIGGCVLFDREILEEAGGFRFWPLLPPAHAGEDAAAQWRVMELAGGAGILPSRAVHLEVATSVTDRRVEATDVVFAEETRNSQSPSHHAEKEQHHGRPAAQLHRSAEVPQRR